MEFRKESTLRDTQEISKLHGQKSRVNSTHQNKETILYTVESLLFIKPQLITNTPNVLQVSVYKRHVSSWEVAAFLRSLDDCEWFDRHQKCFDELSFRSLFLNVKAAVCFKK
jgi:hypothetical protein